MRSSSSCSVAGLAVLCCALSACGSGTSASTPSVAVSSVAAPTPVASAPSSSVASRTPTASASGSYDPALVVEAEKVFREYQAAFTKWQQKGGSTQLPHDFVDLTAMPLRTEVATLLRDQRAAGWHLDSTSHPVIAIYGPINSVHRPGQVIALDACVSYRDMTIINRDGTKKAGVAYEYHAFFSETGNKLHYFDVESAEVRKC